MGKFEICNKSLLKFSKTDNRVRNNECYVRNGTLFDVIWSVFIQVEYNLYFKLGAFHDQHFELKVESTAPNFCQGTSF